MKITNLKIAIKKAKLDPKVSIKRVCLWQNEKISYHTAQILKQVNAHFHKNGDEIYQIIYGRGLIYIGSVDKNKKVGWYKPKLVKENDVFNIPAGFAHCLKNLSKKPLIITFFCPPQHLKNDRFIVNNPF